MALQTPAELAPSRVYAAGTPRLILYPSDADLTYLALVDGGSGEFVVRTLDGTTVSDHGTDSPQIIDAVFLELTESFVGGGGIEEITLTIGDNDVHDRYVVAADLRTALSGPLSGWLALNAASGQGTMFGANETWVHLPAESAIRIQLDVNSGADVADITAGALRIHFRVANVR